MTAKPHNSDFDFEPISGLPSKLPEDETILWRGSPEKWKLGHRIFATRWIAAFFVVLAVSSIFSGIDHGVAPARIAMTFATLLFVGASVIGFAMLFGWLVAINTVYTITDKRIVIRHGVTMPMAVNVPYAKIATAAAKLHADGTGDVSVALLDGNRVNVFAIWPHHRPWSWQGAAPAMKSVPEASRVAQLLHDALVADVTDRGDVYSGTRPKIQIRTRDRERRPAQAANDVAGTAGTIAARTAGA